MANQIIIDIGAVANDGTGDPLRTAFGYVNDNFSNVWATGVANSNIQFSGNRILTVNTNGNLVLAPNGTGKVQSNVDIVPNANNVLSLGSPTLKWNTVYTRNLEVDGNVTFAGNIDISADLTVDGNLTVNGTTTTINTANVDIEDKVITIAFGSPNAAVANGSGITVAGANANIIWTTGSGWTMNDDLVVSGNITGTNITAPGGDQDVIFNRNGVLSAASGFNYNYPGNILYAPAAGFSGDISVGVNGLFVGLGSFTPLGSDIIGQFTANVNAYSQINTQNINSEPAASGDYIITADNGTDSTHFINLGITSSTWDGSQPNSLGNRLGPNDGYLYIQDGNLTLGVSNGGINIWRFDNTGNLTLPGNTFAVNYANGVQVNLSTYGNANVANYLPTYSGLVAGNSMILTQGGNVWSIDGQRLTAPSGGAWFSDAGNNDEYISTGADGYLTLLSLYANTAPASEIQLQHAQTKIIVRDGVDQEWDFSVNGTLTTPGNIVPNANNVYSLGTLSSRWSNLYLSGNTIYLGDLSLSASANGLTSTTGFDLENSTAANIEASGNISATNFIASEWVYGNVGVDASQIQMNDGVGNSINLLNSSGSLIYESSAGASGGFIPASPNTETIGRADNPWGNIFGNFVYANTVVSTLGEATGNIVSNVRTWDSAGANLYVWFDAAETPEIVELNTISGGNVNGWTVSVDGGNQALITATNPAGYFSISTDQALTGSGTLTFTSPDYEPPAANPLTVTVGANDWTFDNTGNLTLPSQGNIVGTTPNNTGHLQWVGASSGDGNGYTTLRLIPDDTVVGNDQYLIIDPTFGPTTGHIHIRAGGTQDNSTADLFLGGENSYVKLPAGSNPAVQLASNNYLWTLNTDGTAEVPNSAYGYAQFYTNNSANLYLGSASYPVNIVGSNGDIVIPGTVSANGNISGNYILGNGSQLTGLPASYTDANVTALLSNLGSNTISGTGNITTTANIAGQYVLGNAAFMTGIPASYGNANVATFLASYGSNSITTTGNITAGNITGNINITGNVTGTSANVDLVAGSYTWSFNNTGNLVLPGNTFAVNYANGTAVSLGGGTYGNANVVTLMSAFGSNTISTTGTVTAGNVTGGNLISNNSAYANIDFVAGDRANTSAAKTRIVSGTTFSYIQTGNGTAGTTGNIVFSPYLSATQRVVIDTGPGSISAVGNITGGNIVTAGLISATGNITGGNIRTAGAISATGNITAANLGNIAAINLNGNSSQVLYGNGVFADVPGGSTYGDSNVVTLLGTFGSNTISTTGTVTTGTLIGTNNLVVNAPSPTAEGGQLILAWANTSGLTSQGNSTWNLDVDSGSNVRLFYQNASAVTGVLLQGNVTGNSISFPGSGGISVTGNATVDGVGTNLIRRASFIGAANTAVTLDNFQARLGGTPTRLYINTVSGNATLTGTSQTYYSGGVAGSQWVNVLVGAGAANAFPMSGAVSPSTGGEMVVLNFADQNSGTFMYRVTAIVANTSSGNNAVTIERLA